MYAATNLHTILLKLKKFVFCLLSSTSVNIRLSYSIILELSFAFMDVIILVCLKFLKKPLLCDVLILDSNIINLNLLHGIGQWTIN